MTASPLITPSGQAHSIVNTIISLKTGVDFLAFGLFSYNWKQKVLLLVSTVHKEVHPLHQNWTMNCLAEIKLLTDWDLYWFIWSDFKRHIHFQLGGSVSSVPSAGMPEYYQSPVVSWR